jgi:hypothetical protein
MAKILLDQTDVIDNLTTNAADKPLSAAQGVELKKQIDGLERDAPHIGDNGNWFIGETDTGVKASGTDGKDGKDGEDGVTPHIGANGNWFIGDTDTGVAAGGGGSEYEIPTFNLVALGLPTIIPNGQYVRVATDTAEIIAALEKGAVKIIVNFNMGAEIAVSLVLNPASVVAAGEYSCTATSEFNGIMLITTVGVGNGYIAAKCTPMDNIIGAYIDAALGGDY